MWVRGNEFEVYTGKTDGEWELSLGGNIVKHLTRISLGITTLCIMTTTSQVPPFLKIYKIRFMHVVHTVQVVNAIVVI